MSNYVEDEAPLTGSENKVVREIIQERKNKEWFVSKVKGLIKATLTAATFFGAIVLLKDHFVNIWVYLKSLLMGN